MGAPLQTEWSKRLGYHINSKLVSNLMYWRNMALYHDADNAIVIDGQEGTGKSLLAMQIGKFLDKDNELTLDQIQFDSESVIKAARTFAPGKVIIYDESGESMDVSLASSKKQRKIKQMFKEVRQRNLQFILVLPSYYDLQRFFALHRTRALVHVFWEANISDVESEKYFKRGKYVFYNERGKKKLYVTDKLRKEYEYPVRWDNQELSLFTGQFFKHYPIDVEAYKKKKREHSKSLNEEEEERPKVDWRKECVRVLEGLDRLRLLKLGWVQASAALMGRGRRWMSEAKKDIAFSEEGDMGGGHVCPITTTTLEVEE